MWAERSPGIGGNILVLLQLISVCVVAASQTDESLFPRFQTTTVYNCKVAQETKAEVQEAKAEAKAAAAVTNTMIGRLQAQVHDQAQEIATLRSILSSSSDGVVRTGARASVAGSPDTAGTRTSAVRRRRSCSLKGTI
jgi:signal transduction histidine kinase